MALEKSTEIRKIEAVGQYRAVQVATDTVVKEDGNELSRSRHRHVLYPHMDVSGEDAGVQAIAGAVFNANCLEAYRLNQVGVRSETT